VTKITDSQQHQLQQLQYFEHSVCRFRRLCRMFRSERKTFIAAAAAAAAATAAIDDNSRLITDFCGDKTDISDIKMASRLRI